MQKLFRILVVTTILALLSACSLPNLPRQEADPDDSMQIVVTPSIPTSEEYYQTLLPYLPNQTRGTVGSLSTRLDMSYLELGLIELAQIAFDREQHLFQEGQVITADEADRWLRRYDVEKNTQGLNPTEGSSFLVHILEHDYLRGENHELGGIALALSINPYEINDEGKKVLLPIDEQRRRIEDLGEKIVERIRAKEVNAPILIGGFSMASSSSLVPGVYINYGLFGAGKDRSDSWKPIDEKYILYPSRGTLEGAERDMETQFLNYKDQVQDFFIQYAGVVGLVRFLDNKPVEMTITVNTEYTSKTEIIAITQYMAGLIPEYFSDTIHIEINIQAMDRKEALYVRPVEGEPFFHVYQ